MRHRKTLSGRTPIARKDYKSFNQYSRRADYENGFIEDEKTRDIEVSFPLVYNTPSGKQPKQPPPCCTNPTFGPNFKLSNQLDYVNGIGYLQPQTTCTPNGRVIFAVDDPCWVPFPNLSFGCDSGTPATNPQIIIEYNLVDANGTPVVQKADPPIPILASPTPQYNFNAVCCPPGMPSGCPSSGWPMAYFSSIIGTPASYTYIHHKQAGGGVSGISLFPYCGLEAGSYTFTITSTMCGSCVGTNVPIVFNFDILGGPPAPCTYVCSGVNGATDPQGNFVLPWDCYDDGSGTGVSWSVCKAGCIPPPPCPTNNWNMIPYGYQKEWYHDPDNTYTNHSFWGEVELPPPTPPDGLPTPPFHPVGQGQIEGPPIPIGTLFDQTQLDAAIDYSAFNSLSGLTEDSLMAPFWQYQSTPAYPNPPTHHPSHVLMSNPTAHFDYENRFTLCEWCADWVQGGVPGNMAGSTPGTFNPQVLNWPLFIGSSWGVSEAEDMCVCCPANYIPVPPAGYVYPLPPEDQFGVRGKWIPDSTFPLCTGLGYYPCW